MTGDRRVEVNPGEMFAVSENLILAAEYESIIGDVFSIGSPEHQLAYMFTFKGRVNNTDRMDSFTVAMSPADALEHATMILDGLEMLQRWQAQQEAKGDQDQG